MHTLGRLETKISNVDEHCMRKMQQPLARVGADARRRARESIRDRNGYSYFSKESEAAMYAHLGADARGRARESIRDPNGY